MICINFEFFFTKKTNGEKDLTKARESHTTPSMKNANVSRLARAFSLRLVLQIKQIGCSWTAEHGVTNSVCFVVAQIHFRLQLRDVSLTSPIGLDIDSSLWFRFQGDIPSEMGLSIKQRCFSCISLQNQIQIFADCAGKHFPFNTTA